MEKCLGFVSSVMMMTMMMMMGHDENDNNYVSTLYDLCVCTCT